MIEFQARKKLRRVLYSPFLLIVLFVALFFFSRATFSLWQKSAETKDTLSALINEKEALKTKKENLAARVAALGTDKGVEEAIREKFRVVKEGEGVIVVVDQKDTEGEVLTPVAKLTVELTAILEKVKSFFR